jgi:hypothetical protein
MIDLYPPSITDLASYPQTGFVWPNCLWLYDGARHFSLHPSKPPRHHYIGVRHRLDVEFSNKPDISWFQKLKLRVRGDRRGPSGTLVKPLIQKWRRGEAYITSHRSTLTLSNTVLLPLLHYRYTPAILRKLEWAPADGGYSKGNSDYLRIEKTLSQMQKDSASFVGPHSRPVKGFADFQSTGNAVW